jgi:DNA-binding IclR family transcriptional regulator
VLIALELLGSSHPRELSRLLKAPVSGVSRAIVSLERDGLVSSRLLGRTRAVQLNPSYFAREELRPYLKRLAEADGELRSRAGSLRRRPRRADRPL